MSTDPDPEAPTLNNCPVELYVDGVKQSDISHNSLPDGGARVTMDADHNLIRVEYPNVLLVEMSAQIFGACHFSQDISLLDCDSTQDVIGLLGSPNGNARDDWMDRDGTILDIPSGANAFFFEPAYTHTMTWMIKDEEESIFVHDDIPFEEYDKSDVPYDVEYENQILNSDPEIEEFCGNDIGCRIDGLVGGIEGAVSYKRDPASARTAELDFDDSSDLCTEEL